MGIVNIKFSGSFDAETQDSACNFSAMDKGHAAAVEAAAKHLTENVLPKAVAQDLRLAAKGDFPEMGFGPTVKRELEKQAKDILCEARNQKPQEKLILACENPACDRATEADILYCCHGCNLAQDRHHEDGPLSHSELCDRNQKEWRA